MQFIKSQLQMRAGLG